MTSATASGSGDLLLPYQRRWIEDLSEWKIAEKGRRTGLTWAEAADAALVAAAAKNAGGCNHSYIGSGKEMAREFIDACAGWAQAFALAASEVGEEVFVDEGRDGRSVTPKGLHAAVGKVLATLLGGAPGDGTVYQLKGKADGTLVLEERTQDGASMQGILGNAAAIGALAARVTAVEGKTAAATTTRKGIAELATGAEAKAGTDATRIVTPKGMRDSTAANIASLLAQGNIEAGKQYALEGLAGGGLKLALSSLLLLSMTVTLRSRIYEWYDGDADSYEIVQVQRDTVDSGDTLALAQGLWLAAAWVDPVPNPSWVRAYPATRPYAVDIPGLAYYADQPTGGAGNFRFPSPHWQAGVVGAGAGGVVLSPGIAGSSYHSGTSEVADRIGDWYEIGTVTLKAAAVRMY